MKSCGLQYSVDGYIVVTYLEKVDARKIAANDDHCIWYAVCFVHPCSEYKFYPQKDEVQGQTGEIKGKV